MGREIRKVSAIWEHPSRDGQFIPLFDRDFETEAREWIDNCVAWDNGTHQIFKDHPEYKNDYPSYWQYDGGPPDEKFYRPKWDEKERTHYQMYETVSEGTPVTPHFASKEELVDYLVKYGDFGDQKRGQGGWDRKNAESFVQMGFALSGMVAIKDGKANILEPRDGGI